MCEHTIHTEGRCPRSPHTLSTHSCGVQVDSLMAIRVGSSCPEAAQRVLSSTECCWAEERRSDAWRAWLHMRDIVLAPARRPHERRLYNTQVVWSGLIKLSNMCLKACQDSLVAMDAHSERPIEFFTSSRHTDTVSFFRQRARSVSSRRPRRVFSILSALKYIAEAKEACKSTNIHMTSA